VIYQKATDSAFIAVTSQPLGGKTPDQWATDYLGQATGEDACGPTEPYTIDGSNGVISSCGDGLHAVVSAGGRAHVIWLYSIDDPGWFKQILDTVQLDPSAAMVPPPALTETFTSAFNGISIGYPAGWHLRTATESWTAGQDLNQDAPIADVMYEKPVDSQFIAVASQPLAGQTADEWATTYLSTRADGAPCDATEPYTIDGEQGVVAQCGDLGPHAIVAAGERIYVIWLYRNDDLDWFKQILDTVKLDPAAAK